MSESPKPGARFRSVACATEVVVVACRATDVDLRCGGVPMVPASDTTTEGLALTDGFDGGTLIGKRYIDPDGELELLCTKPGDGSLSIGDTPLEVKGAKPLPSSD